MNGQPLSMKISLLLRDKKLQLHESSLSNCEARYTAVSNTMENTEIGTPTRSVVEFGVADSHGQKFSKDALCWDLISHSREFLLAKLRYASSIGVILAVVLHFILSAYCLLMRSAHKPWERM